MTDSASYRLGLSNQARRRLHRIPGRVAAAIITFSTGPLLDPGRRSSPLVNELSGYRSARCGDYRVLIRIDEAARAVLVVRIDHRTDLYRPRLHTTQMSDRVPT